MKTLAWNCQGLGSTLTVRHLKDISSQYAPQVYFLSETKQQKLYMEKVCADLKCHDVFTVEPQGLSGGLALLWQEEVEVEIVSACTRWIDAKVTWRNKKFWITGMYGDPVSSEREAVWDQVIAFGEDRTEPWIMLGDFNDIFSNDDKRGGRVRPEASFYPFRNMLTKCGLLELPFRGNSLSWFGNRGGEQVHCKLDRVVANVEWYIQFPAATSQYLPRIGSDHSPVLTYLNGEDHRRRGQFRYDNRWIDKEGFTETIAGCWSNEAEDTHDFVSRIRSCRTALANWKRSSVSNSQVMITDLKYQIDSLTHSSPMDWDLYNALKAQLVTAYNQEEQYWKQRSRAHWLKEGDRNSKFFHASVKQKRINNRIRCLSDDDNGSMLYNDSEMGNLACSFFSKLYTSELLHTSSVRHSPLFSGVESRITEAQNQQLIRPATVSEIKMAAFGMSPNKCAGPDGFTGSFFQQHWGIVGTHVCELINQFLQTGSFDSRINDTTICLIPKKQCPTRLTEFRPISLCNYIYKIISKLLATRLKELLPCLISETQAAFVKGRLISDNILLAHEILHSLKTSPELSDSFVAIKTDMMKAFDRVEWQFLEDALHTLGFHSTWITWIMQCVTTVSFGVLVNGQRYGSFTPSRGLRQGDPLSPFLFIICTEILITRLNRRDTADQFHGIQIASTAPSISHLFFADDSLFFSSVEEQQLRVLKSIIEDYKEASGQKVNLEKSSIIYGPKVPEAVRTQVQTITGIQQIGGNGVYLGMPETFLGSKTETLQFIEDRVRSRLGSWKNKYLSLGGKEVLIKAVAQAIPAYAMSCYLLPKGLISDITSAYSKFWWRNKDTDKGIHWHSWEKLARRKEEGGLNFRHLEGFNMALLSKQLWRLCQNPDTVLARTLKGKYFPQETSAFYGKLGLRPSFGWRSILEGKKLLMLGVKREFGNGDQIDIYRDPWLLDDLSPNLPRPARPLPHVHPPSIHQLKDIHSDEWNIQNLRQFFDPHECECILKVKPGGIASNSGFSWIHNSSGLYSVKSGYWVWSSSSLNPYQASEQKPNYSAIYEQIWKQNTSNKIKNFMWRCISSSLPVGRELRKRRIKDVSDCALCGAEVEDINHLLYQCDLAKEVWRLTDHGTLLDSDFKSESVACNLWTCISPPPSLHFTTQEDKHLWPWLLWRIWKARNEFLFQRITTSATSILERAKADAIEWNEHNHCKNEPVSANVAAPPNSEPEKWIAPAPNFLKCNVDAAWQEDKDVSGISWILRDHTGRVRLHGTRVFPKLLSPLEAEATALVWAVNCMWNMGYENVIFESDSQTLIQALQTPLQCPRLVTFITEITGIISRRPWHTQFHHISRKKNAAADTLAKHALSNPIYFGSIDNFLPLWLQPSLDV